MDSDGEALDASEMPYLSLHPTAGARPADPRTVQHLSPWHLSRRPPPGIPAASLRRGTHVTCAVYSDVGEIAATYNDDDVYLFAPEASMVGLGGAEGRFLVDLTGLKASGARCGGGFARDRDNLGNYCNIFSIFVLFAWMLRLHECCYLRFRSCFIC